jgi:hypothetical protein
MDILDYSDIPYNFMIGDDGFVYEGRGFKYQATFDGVDDDFELLVAFIGRNSFINPSARQLSTLKDFLKLSVRRDALSAGFDLIDILVDFDYSD